jgi:hypothetical protein
MSRQTGRNVVPLRRLEGGENNRENNREREEDLSFRPYKSGHWSEGLTPEEFLRLRDARAKQFEGL